MKKSSRVLSTITLMVSMFLFLNTGALADIFSGTLNNTTPSKTHTLVLANNGKLTINALIDSTLCLGYSEGGITIFDSDGITVLEDFNGPYGGSDTEGSYGPFPLRAGTYYIKVKRYNTSYGNYSLSTSFTPISPLTTNDIEPNETSATATNMPLNTAVTGQLGYYGGGQGTSADSQDWWKVIIPKYGSLTLNAQINSTLCLGYSEGGITIFDSDGITVLEDFNGPYGGSDTEGSYGPFVLNAGTYYIRVKRYDTSFGVYSLYASIPVPVTTTTTTRGTTTSTTISSNCPSDYPLDCHDGTCCPEGYPYHCPSQGECSSTYSSDCNINCSGGGGTTTTTTTTTTHRRCGAANVLGEDNPKLENLRDFRDSSLAQSAVGRKIIQIYYNNSDSINDAIDRSPVLRAVTRRVLEVIAPMVGKK